MKKILFSLIIITFLADENANSQCEYKSIRKAFLKLANSDNCSVEIDISTTLSVKLFTRLAISYIKSGDKYYLFTYYRKGGGKQFKILKNNSLELVFMNRKSLKVYPCGDFSGKKQFEICSYYIVTKDQLQQISNNIVESVRISLSCDKVIKDALIDNEGNQYLEFEMRSIDKSQVWSEDAACILTK